jgi:hypothetical protein
MTVRSSGSQSAKTEFAHKLNVFDRRQLCRALAAGEPTRADLARAYGVTRTYVSAFAKQYATEIDQFRAQLGDQLAGLWIADKGSRVLAHQSDYTMLLAHGKRDHHEWVRARTAILQAVAEELGQLPPRTMVTVVPVIHVVESVDLEALK